jgi:hypothetical protein
MMIDAKGYEIQLIRGTRRTIAIDKPNRRSPSHPNSISQ